MKFDEKLLFAADSSPFGKTYGNWTVAWWKWASAIPKSLNPVLDVTGEFSGVNQKERFVLFLAGKLADSSRNFPTRSYTVSNEKSILFPIINCEFNQLENPELKTTQDLARRVEEEEGGISKIECALDGMKIQPQRVKSDPLIFDLDIVENNLFNIKNIGRTHASADGYWVFLKPLPHGEHIISFCGSCEYGKLNSGATYFLEVR